MPIGIPRPTGKGVADLHYRLLRDWQPRLGLDEEFRDLIHGLNKIETLEPSADRNITPQEVHCLHTDTPILTRDLQWVRAGSLDKGSRLVGFNENSQGELPSRFRRFEEATVIDTSVVEASGYIITLENGEVLRATGEHKFLIMTASNGHNAAGAQWISVSEIYERLHRRVGGAPPAFRLVKYLDIWDADRSYEAGFLAGAFDADGTLTLCSRGSKQAETLVKFSQQNNELLAKVKDYLTRLGFDWHEAKHDQPSKAAKAPVHVLTLRGGLRETMRFLGRVRPPRLLARWERFNLSLRKFENRGTKVRIIDVELSRFPIAQITSSSATYISAGYGSHNSGRAGGIIEHANGLLMAQPRFHAEPLTLGTAETREAETVERAVAGVFEEHLLANDFWPSVGRDILSFGRGFLKAMLSTSEWTAQTGYPVRDQNETGADYLKRIRDWKESEGRFPFIIRYVPALSILPLLDTNDNVVATIEEKWVTAKVLADDMGSQEVKEALSRRSLRWYDQLMVIEYLDTEWVGYFLASLTPRERSVQQFPHRRPKSYIPLRTWRHQIGKHPVVMLSGIKTGEEDFLRRWKSFLYDAKDAFKLYDASISRLATLMWAHYLPSYVWHLATAQGTFAGKERPTMNIKLGGVTVLFADEALEVLPMPQELPDALALLQVADDTIQRSCAAVSDRIRLADGTLTTYGELADSGKLFEVVAPDDGFTTTRSTQAFAYHSVVDDIYEIKFESGRSMKANAHHRVAVSGHGVSPYIINSMAEDKLFEWAYCDEVQEGDYVLATTNVSYDEDKELGQTFSPSVALQTGLILGDGWAPSRGNVVFRNNSQPILDLFKQAAIESQQPISYGKDVIRILRGQGRGGNDRSVRPITQDKAPVLYALTQFNVYDKKASEKSLPEEAWRLPKESALAMLRGLLISDGWVDKYGALMFGSYSKSLRDWVSDTAHRFGCPGRNNERIDAYGKPLYEWFAFTEFVDNLIGQTGPLTGKLHADKISPGRGRIKRKVNDALYRERVVEVNLLPPEQTVCVVVLGDGQSITNNHIYATPYISHNTLQDVLFGRVQGAAPAFQVNLRIGVAKSKLTPIAQHMAIGISNVMELFFRGIEQLKEAVVVGGETVTVAMAKKYRNRVTASIRPKSPIDRNQDMGVANMALQFGMPWDWIVEKILDVEEPATLRLMKDIRALEESEPLQTRLQLDALEQLEALIEEEDFEDLEGVDLSQLSPEMAQALGQLRAPGVVSQREAAAFGAGQPVGGVPSPEEVNIGLGRGPFPAGASAQSIQGGRGLLTPKAQPSPGTPLAGSEPEIGV